MTTETKEIPLTPQFWQNFHNKKFNVSDWLKEQHPDFVIDKYVLINNMAMYPDGAIYMKYRQKTEDELYRERFEFLMSNTPVYKSKPEQAKVKFGCCPECKQYILNWKPVFGGLAPEWWATMRDNGIDPATGHLESCSIKR